MNERRTSLVLHGIVLFILFLSMIQIFIDSRGLFFRLELLGLAGLLVLGVSGMLAYQHTWGKVALFFTYVFYLLNLFLIWYVYTNLYVVLIIVAILGFFLSLPERKIGKEVVKEPHSVVFDEPVQTEIIEAEEEVKKSVTKHFPGKYVASVSSNVYHEPKCDWAKRIHKARRVWFDAKEKAWEKGYKGHSCVE